MKITFLGQGFEPESKNSVGNQIIRLFKEEKFNSFTGISAFASEAGVSGLAKCIIENKEHFENISLVVGIDQEGTSKKALKRILELNINSYIFYQKESPIFHPKIYLFEGEKNTALIIGSSNLTARGYFGNIESSLLVEFDNDNQQGEKLVVDMKNYFSTLFDYSDQNLFKISDELIESFVKKGVVPTKKVWKKKHKKHTSNKLKNDIGIVIPSRPTSSIPSFFKGSYKSKKIVSNVIDELEKEGEFEIDMYNNQLVWQSGKLTERDLNIPKGKKTNPTGSMLLKKGLMKKINTRHYFRDEVFSDLQWKNDEKENTKHIERTTVNIRMVILEVDYGIYDLEVSHNTRSEHLESVKQPATQIHWGVAKALIAQEELIGKEAKIYKNKTASNIFTLVIE